MQRRRQSSAASQRRAVVVGLGSWWAVGRRRGARPPSAAPAVARPGSCRAEAEDGGTEVSAELQSAGPGEAWQVELTRDDTSLLTGTRTTDEDGEIDVDAYSAGNPGDATYAVTFTPADGEPCTATLGS